MIFPTPPIPKWKEEWCLCLLLSPLIFIRIPTSINTSRPAAGNIMNLLHFDFSLRDGWSRRLLLPLSFLCVSRCFFFSVLISIQIRLQDGAAVLEASGLPRRQMWLLDFSASAGENCFNWIKKHLVPKKVAGVLLTATTHPTFKS